MLYSQDTSDGSEKEVEPDDNVADGTLGNAEGLAHSGPGRALDAGFEVAAVAGSAKRTVLACHGVAGLQHCTAMSHFNHGT